MTKIDDAVSGDLATNWPAVVAVATATFSVVTTEMLPIGLLPAIGGELGVSTGTAGLTMTIPGLVAAGAAPLVALGIGRLDRRWVLVGLAGLLTVANLFSASATGFTALLALRVLVGVCIGGIWAVAGGLAVRLVPPASVGSATSVIFSGIAVASVLGVPAGTLAGDLFGWRAAFLAMGGLSLGVTLALIVLLPPLPTAQAVRLGELARLLRDHRIRAGLLVIMFLVTGHFAAYTYVRPTLEGVFGVAPTLVSALLLLFGGAGVAGNFLAGTAAARDPRRALLVITVMLAAILPVVPIGNGVVVAVVLLLGWGLGYGGVSVSTQSWLLASAPRASEAATTLFVAVFNVAISLGALVGGWTVDVVSPAGVMWLGGALAAAALVTVAASRSGPRLGDRVRT